MRTSKSKYVFLIISIIIAGGILLYRESQAADIKALSALKREKPALAPFVDEITALLKKKVGKSEQVRHYLTNLERRDFLRAALFFFITPLFEALSTALKTAGSIFCASF